MFMCDFFVFFLYVFGLERLELRRLHTDVITCYIIINNLVAVQFDSLFKFAVNTNTRGHLLKLICYLILV